MLSISLLFFFDHVYRKAAPSAARTAWTEGLSEKKERPIIVSPCLCVRTHRKGEFWRNRRWRRRSRSRRRTKGARQVRYPLLKHRRLGFCIHPTGESVTDPPAALNVLLMSPQPRVLLSRSLHHFTSSLVMFEDDVRFMYWLRESQANARLIKRVQSEESASNGFVQVYCGHVHVACKHSLL